MSERKCKRRRVVVTGGAGFVGSHLCDALLERGDAVTCVDNLTGCDGSTRNVDHLIGQPHFELVVEDSLEWAAHADLRGVTYLFHNAASKSTRAQRNPELDLRVNAHTTLRLLLRAAEHGVTRFIHASTGSVFGRTDECHDDRLARDPVSLYGVSKLAAESYCRVVGEQFGLNVTVLRYYHVVGPRQSDSLGGGVVPIFVRRCLEGRPIVIHGSGEQVRSFTSVGDVVRANLLVAESEAACGLTFNCASGTQVTVRELAEFVAGELGNLHPFEFGPARPGDVMEFRVDNAPLRELGLSFDQDWRSMVRGVIAAQRERQAAAV